MIKPEALVWLTHTKKLSQLNVQTANSAISINALTLNLAL